MKDIERIGKQRLGKKVICMKGGFYAKQETVRTSGEFLSNPLHVFYSDQEMPMVYYYAHRAMRVVWVYLTPRHSKSSEFWRMFQRAARYLDAQSVEILTEEAHKHEIGYYVSKMVKFMEQLHLEEPCTLVFENVQLLRTGPTKEFIAWLRGYPVKNLNLALISRTVMELWRDGKEELHRLTDPDYALSRVDLQVYLLAHQKKFQKEGFDYFCSLTQMKAGRIRWLLQILGREEVLSRMTIYQALRRSAAHTGGGPGTGRLIHPGFPLPRQQRYPPQ